MKALFDLMRATVVVCSCCMVIQAVASAQSTRGRKSEEPDLKELEKRLSSAEETLVTEYKEVAVQIYNQGDKERSLSVLKRLKELNPRLKGLDDRIDSIAEELLQENMDDFELDTREGIWEPVGMVAENKTFRLQAAGETRVSFSGSVSVNGLEPKKDAKDYLPGVPLGALIGAIVTDGKPGKPFPVRSQLEMTPKKGGQLFLKVNVPDGTRCSGKIKVRVSGYISLRR